MLTLARIVINDTHTRSDTFRSSSPAFNVTAFTSHLLHKAERKNLHKYVLLKAPRGEEREREREAKGDE
jgi:hypothetical protein